MDGQLYSDYRFFRFSELDGPSPAKTLEPYQQQIAQVLPWIHGLTHTHPDLGRAGPICPYVGGAIEKDLIFFDIYEGSWQDMDGAYQTLRSARDYFFGKMEPLSGEDLVFKNLIILFPNMREGAPPGLIDDMQDELIDEWAAQGKMIGEFHPNSIKPGLWSDTFKPFFCPVPILAMRLIFPVDIYFLKRKENTTRSYLEHFKHKIPERIREAASEAAERYGIDFEKFDRPNNAHPDKTP